MKPLEETPWLFLFFLGGGGGGEAKGGYHTAENERPEPKNGGLEDDLADFQVPC